MEKAALIVKLTELEDAFLSLSPEDYDCGSRYDYWQAAGIIEAMHMCLGQDLVWGSSIFSINNEHYSDTLLIPSLVRHLHNLGIG